MQPDVFVAPLMPGGRKVRDWREIKNLLLAVEVLSPSTARVDRQVKRRLYQEGSVGEYWIVDLDGRVIECWRPGDDRPAVLGDRLTWRPDSNRPPFELDLPAFFRDVMDD